MMVIFSSANTPEEMADTFQGVAQFRLDVAGAADAFAWVFGHGDGYEPYAARAHDPIAYDSESGVWRDYISGMGWAAKPEGILKHMNDVYGALCALEAQAIVDRDADEKPIDPDPEIARENRQKWLAKVEKEYAKLRVKHLSGNVPKAVKVTEGLLTVPKWNTDDARIGLPDGETLHVTPAHPIQAVRQEREEPNDHITRHMAAAPGMISVKWEQFLDDLTNGDAEMQTALQVWCGAAMMPGNAEAKSHVLYGDGLTGKSTFLKTIMTACGDYAGSARASVFTSDKDSHPAELLPFIHKRIVVLPELPRGALRGDLIKTVTGGDSISVRAMRENPRTETPQATLFFSANELPSIWMVDNAIRRRLLIWPFDHQPKKVNVNLGKQLVDDDNIGGVVAWIVDGIKAYIRLQAKNEALPIPNAVAKATEEYFRTADNVGQWRDEVLADTGETDGPVLYQSFTAWCEGRKRKPLGERAFFLWMGRKYDKRHTMKGNLYPVSVRRVPA